MKTILLFLFLFSPVLAAAQGHKGTVETCAPVKGGKICYYDEVEVKNAAKNEIYTAIRKWANKEYGRDIFLSNVSSNGARGSILVSSKIEILLGEADKTQVKYRMWINCMDGKYTVEVSDITYQYDPGNERRFKSYKAEDVIMNGGKENKVGIIKDPALFCNATFFFVENLFADVYSAAKEAQ